MGKSVKSKVKRRFRAAKREHIKEHVEKERIAEKNAKLIKIASGEVIKTPGHPKNAFLYPGNPDAAIPQKKISKPLDLRSDKLAYAAFAGVGNRRKFTPAEIEELGIPDHGGVLQRRYKEMSEEKMVE